MIDITQEVFSGAVYPGDTLPAFRRVCSLESGDDCSLTDFSMCAHNGTHMDAPSHFLRGGKSVEAIDLSRYIGRCSVYEFAGPIRAEDVAEIWAERVLLRGPCALTEEAARILASRCLLVGVESQSVGDASIHRILLAADVVVLEGANLRAAQAGDYVLVALPLKLGGADGAPVRAVLLNQGKEGVLL